jgi:hypothetical protein
MKYLLVILGSITLVAIIAIVMAFPVKWLWNWLMPTIFGLIKINVWQVFGLNLLSGLLLKSTYTNSNK